MTRLARLFYNEDIMENAKDEWRKQWDEQFYCGGSPEDQAAATFTDWIFHILTLNWKVISGFVPPAMLGGGYPCFFVSLCLIGLVTALAGDAASLLGCCLDIPDDITAITLVALGTSLPDTFASRTAAQHDDSADNAVGNVTGSNAVNIFLGVGISWTLGAVYWERQGVTDAWRRH